MDMGILSYIKAEAKVIRERDPAIKSNLEIILYPGFRAVLYYRLRSEERRVGKECL